MAIETTRGLPSFSEMYSAFKNRGSIGDAISAGTKGFTDARAARSKSDLEAANAEEATAHADYYRTQAAGGLEKKVPLAALPDSAKAALAAYADAQGNVSEAAAKVYLSNTAQGQAAEKATNELALREQALAQQTRHQQEMEAVNQQLADLKAALGQSGQELDAAQTIANTTRGASPSLAQKLMGKIGDVTGVEALVPSEVIKSRQNAAALEKLSGISKLPTEIPVAERGVVPPTADMIANPPVARPEPKRIFPARGQGKGTESSPARVNSQADYDKLPVGAWFVDSTGKPTQKKPR